MESKNFKSLESVLKFVARKDSEYVFIRHVLKPRERVKAHYHPKADETLIVLAGQFTVSFGRHRKKLDKKKFSNDIFNFGTIWLIKFPAKEIHAFTAQTKVSYFVIRTCPDKTVYIRKKK